jgi:hypothetical protein
VAVQAVPAAGMPVTVKMAGVSGLSEAGCGELVTLPAPQERLTLTALGLLSLKCLCTVNVAEFSLFVIVQEGEPPAASGTPM